MADPPFMFYPEIPGIPPIPGIDPFWPISPIPPIDLPPPRATTKQVKDPKARKFFLTPQNYSDPMQFRGAARDSLAVNPIIDGKEIFIALEKAVMNAESSVLLAFWALNPEMKTVTDSSVTWLELLMEAAERNVMVRVFLNDFDPGLQLAQHANVWKGYVRMVNATTSIPVDMFQVVCSHHEAETADSVMKMVRPGLIDNLADQINKETEAVRKALFSFAPGLWDKMDFIASTNTVAPKVKNASYPAWPAVHHQKIAIIDGKYAYTGGINITDSYVDTQKHEKPQIPWHDAFVKVEGSMAVRDFIGNYIGLWNQERVRAEAFLTNAYASLNVKITPLTRATSDLTDTLVPAKLTSTTPPKIPSQIHRTITRKGTDPTGVPSTLREDILEGYLLAIGLAEDYIYIENQYFREKAIGDAIIQRHSQVAGLQTIIVLPQVAEEFLNNKGDELSLHGAALQFEILDSMITQIGANLGLFTMVRKDNQQVYVHSKLLIIDDTFASIGSANSNPRSYRVDTELDFVWYEATIAKKLRTDLWNEMLGKPATMKRWKPSQFVAKWTAIAKKNISGSASAQKGFAMPFENNNKGKKSLFDISPFT